MQNGLKIRSQLPGRVRWDATKLVENPKLAERVAHSLADHPDVRNVVANPRTGRILVEYNPALSLVHIESLLRQSFEHSAPPRNGNSLLVLNGNTEHRHTADCDHSSHSGSCGHDHAHDEGCGHDHSGEPSAHVRGLIIGGSVLFGLAVKRLLFGPGVLAGSPFLFLVSAAATVVSGYPFIRGALRTAEGKAGITTDTLVGSATIASLLMRESITALTVIWLLNLGEYLQAITLRRTRQAIRELLEIGEEEVWLVANGVEIRVQLETIRPGDLVVIYAGERIGVDGVIEEGTGTINEAPITGESMPAWRNVGDAVFAGTILLSGDLHIRVQRVGSDTAVGRLIQRVEEAQSLRAPIQTIGERFSESFVPASFALAVGVFLVTGDLYRGLTMLLVACPCAAGLATPTAVSAAIGNAARRGILIKGGAHLEASANVDAVVFDKTGTLTIGMPAVERVVALADDYTPDQVLALAATGELHSQHPLALAVVNHANTREIVIPPHEECEIVVGCGMHAFGPNERILIGNGRLLDRFGVAISADANELSMKHAADGESMMFVAHNDRLVGLIGVRDKIRPEAHAALADLRAIGVNDLVMLTGDGEEAAASVAAAVGLNQWHARMMPEEKYETIRRMQSEGRIVAMVGDGINDAPALALADVGIAMGTAGSDIAIEAADVALAADDVRRVATTIRLSRRAISIVRQNYGMALGVNSVGVVVGAFGAINPFIAAILHNLSTLLVVFNSARLIRFNPDRK